MSLQRDKLGTEQHKKQKKMKERPTVLESSLPVSMMRRQRGMISVESKKVITSVLSFYTTREETTMQQLLIIAKLEGYHKNHKR